MKITSHAFPLHIGDWLKGTMRLRPIERAYYLDLLLYQWDAQAPVPDDEEEQMQIARCTDRREWRAAWAKLQQKFERVEGGWINTKCERVREQMSGVRRARSAAGRGGNAKRWGSQDRADDSPGPSVDPQTESQTPSQAPSQTGRKNIANWSQVESQTESQTGRKNIASVFRRDLDLCKERRDPDLTHTQSARARALAHPPPLIDGRAQREHGQHAWCSWPARDGLCVPVFLHREFVGKLARESADADLRAWYPSVVARYEGRAVGDAAPRFWRNEFEQWVGVVTVPAAPPRSDKGARTAAAADRVMARIRAGSILP